MKNKASIVWEVMIVILVICFVLVCLIPVFYNNFSYKRRFESGNLQEEEWKNLMISKGLAEYNLTNGKWNWKTNVSCSCPE